MQKNLFCDSSLSAYIKENSGEILRMQQEVVRRKTERTEGR